MDNRIYSKIYRWLFIGLLITFGVAYLTLLGVVNNANIARLIFSTGGYWIIAIIEVILAIYLSARIFKMNSSTAKTVYLVYCALTGLTFSSLFIVFEVASIIYVFLVTAIILGAFSYIGNNIKMDLSKFGTYLLMALLGIIILEIVNIFLGNNALDMVTCVVALFVFMFYISYDIQKVKRLAAMGLEEDNLAIMGAFQLYLDFINIFIRLLQIFGNRRD